MEFGLGWKCTLKTEGSSFFADVSLPVFQGAWPRSQGCAMEAPRRTAASRRPGMTPPSMHWTQWVFRSCPEWEQSSFSFVLAVGNMRWVWNRRRLDLRSEYCGIALGLKDGLWSWLWAPWPWSSDVARLGSFPHRPSGLCWASNKSLMLVVLHPRSHKADHC